MVLVKSKFWGPGSSDIEKTYWRQERQEETMLLKKFVWIDGRTDKELKSYLK